MLLSGGLDSAAALYTEHRGTTTALFIDYGQAPAAAELTAARHLASARAVALEVVSLPALACIGTGRLGGLGTASYPDGSTQLQQEEWFPARNLVLIAIAGVFVGRDGIDELCLGTSEQSYRDCRPEFYSAAESALSESLAEGAAIRIRVPDRPRVDVLRDAINAGMQPRLTFSCNRRGDRHCWRCASCRDRVNLFDALGLRL